MNDARISELVNSAWARIEPQPRSRDELMKARAEAANEAGEALRLAEASWGVDDIRLARILSLLAACLRGADTGAHVETRVPLLYRAIALAERAPVPDLVLLGDLYCQIGLALRAAGDPASASTFLERSIQAYERTGRISDVSYCVGVLARTLVEIDPAGALPIFRRYLELEAIEGPKSTSHYLALAGLGRCLVLVGEGEEALCVLGEAKTMVLERASGRPQRWIADLDSEMEKARALIARTSK